MIAECPEGKVPVDTGHFVSGGRTGDPPDQHANVAVPLAITSETGVVVTAYEVNPIEENWLVIVAAVCVTEGTP